MTAAKREMEINSAAASPTEKPILISPTLPLTMPPRRVDAKEALDLATAQSENVFLFLPNLIGYSRIILASLSLYFMSNHPVYCTIAYCVSCLLDAVDGMAARALNQASKFGAVLDMVTDRCTTASLLCYLSSAYPDYALLFQFLIALDFSGHYMHMYSSLVTGQASHRVVRREVSWILRMYYKPSILFACCAGNELFFISLYVIKWTVRPYAQFFALISLPVSALKNFVNIVQLWKASKILVGVDIKERQEALPTGPANLTPDALERYQDLARDLERILTELPNARERAVDLIAGEQVDKFEEQLATTDAKLKSLLSDGRRYLPVPARKSRRRTKKSPQQIT
ncbi:CDP-alcohol phosphatidyltransferase-domain-containing protein [Roridomyces roridus]|uniref:CDP-diacylglycerol--inositol 3-phosphatidyltransferase n=1 Tax=Roridomyces roridus TaxID=1738132 RepID=A0AAD7FW24_9AGAR|nr:CDP-alcohol phosphatidyltransferase-domain-containing protein [Roridomyces roridus]